MTTYQRTPQRTQQADSRVRRLTRPDGGSLLRRALRLDAAASGVFGLLVLAAGPRLEDRLGLPLSVLLPVGLLMLPWAGALWFLASRPQVNRRAAWAVIAANLLWVVESVVLVAAGWFSLTGLGTGFVLAQTALVVLIADLQITGLYRARAAL